VSVGHGRKRLRRTPARASPRSFGQANLTTKLPTSAAHESAVALSVTSEAVESDQGHSSRLVDGGEREHDRRAGVDPTRAVGLYDRAGFEDLSDVPQTGRSRPAWDRPWDSRYRSLRLIFRPGRSRTPRRPSHRATRPSRCRTGRAPREDRPRDVEEGVPREADSREHRCARPNRSS
jgi:hypothetical protein